MSDDKIMRLDFYFQQNQEVKYSNITVQIPQINRRCHRQT